MKTKLKSQKGFTIIEVLIVLAIAGLILLIVFLAVPALQRNSRNTQYKSGAAAILASVNESINNNNGSMPSAVAVGTNGDITVTNSAVATVYGKTQGSYTASVSTTAPAATSTGVFAVAVNRKCNTAQNGLDAATTNRSIAILYNVETGGANTPRCTES